MNIKLILYKNESCELCKAVQEELMNNPPSVEIIIKSTKNEETRKEAELLQITSFPCSILKNMDTEENLYRFYGFVFNEIIDNIIKRYE